ncbi:MAG: T9SS type A sorting domain-containing protein, partial [Bacteroidia bacterium]|nr:T9SS type A sorting domain-containing protein [Bacteroidia bacterium]
IDPSLGGKIQYGTLGTAPNRRFVLSYENVPMYSCGTASPAIYLTSQIKIFEQNDVIEIHVGNKGVCPGWNRGQAVLGLHSYDGKIYVPPVSQTAHNGNVSSPGYTWTMSSTAYRFTAPCSSTVNCLTTLPVNFKAFYCDNLEGVNLIYWETGGEAELKEFLVERSEDGINFEVVGTLLPNNKPSKYVFEDRTYKHGITNYYRISSVEINGVKNQTSIYPVLDKMEKLTVSEPYPNPSHGVINISFSSKQSTLAYYSIKDLYGKEVLAGSYNIEPGITEKNIDCRNLNGGLYLLEISDIGQRVISQRKLAFLK